MISIGLLGFIVWSEMAPFNYFTISWDYTLHFSLLFISAGSQNLRSSEIQRKKLRRFKYDAFPTYPVINNYSSLICPIIPVCSNYKLPILPPHSIVALSHVKSEFLSWFVGFTEAEGCFQVVKNRNGAGLRHLLDLLFVSM
jgi:hypothetical protein